MKKYFNINNVRLVLIFVLVLFLYSFTSNRNLHRKLKGTEVLFVGEKTNFIKQETVNKLLIENRTDVKTIEKYEVILKKLEKDINNNPMIASSEVFISVDGVLKTKVIQKTPIARFFNEKGSFYIDIQGNTMPLSNEETARVAIVLGEINEKNKSSLIAVLKQIYEDDFLKKNITGLQILPDQSVIMTNRNFDYQILFGQLLNIESKFKNYKAFFQKTVESNLLAKYKTINLIFEHQVVATK